jgi:hypothetical protein
MMLDKFADPVLFIDEPTIAAETDNRINDMIMQLLCKAPRQVRMARTRMHRAKLERSYI